MKKTAAQSTISLETQVLYRTFHRYDAGPIPAGCPCCINKKEREKLISKPLQHLTWNDLSRFSFKAMTTWGDTPMFKRFAPRILDLLSQDPPWDLEIILGKFREAKFKSWPEAEQKAVTDFLHVQWQNCLGGSDYLGVEESLLCGLVCGSFDMPSFLEEWINCRSSSGYEFLAEFAEAPFTTAFWNRGYPEQFQVEKWLIASATIDQLRNILNENLASGFNDNLATAIDLIEAFQSRNRL